MKSLLPLFLFVLVSAELLAQNCGERYRSRYFNSIQEFRGVVYSRDAPQLLTATPGVETTYPDDLEMDIFMPPPTDPVQNRPVVILAHGGGFINVAFMGGTVLVGTMDNDDIQALADTLAHWGFVTASIEYRTGFDATSTTSVKRAVWRGAQDMSAAVRFFRKNAQWFGIDPNRVFIGGSSAGAFCCIHSTFVDSNERIPESEQIIPVLMPDLGTLHGRPVEELTGFNPFTGNSVLGDDVDSLPMAIAAYWGAIADTDMFMGPNTAPMIMFHGTDDLIVSPDCAKPFSGVVLTAPVTCGTNVMETTMNSLNLPNEVHTAQGEGHEYWGALNGEWTLTGPNAYWAPMIQETADFFYDVMKPAAPTVTGPANSIPNIVQTYTINNPSMWQLYCWEVDGGTIVSQNQTGASVDVLWWGNTTNGTVRVRAVDLAEVASDWSDYQVAVTTSVAAIEGDMMFNVLPNPVDDILTIRLGGNEQYTVQVMDVYGQVVYTNTQAVDYLEVAVQDWASGIYMIQIINQNGQQYTKPIQVR